VSTARSCQEHVDRSMRALEVPSGESEAADRRRSDLRRARGDR
jgi:hypothetical protein